MNRHIAQRVVSTLAAAVAVCCAFGVVAAPATAAIVKTKVKTMETQHVGFVDLSQSREFAVFMRHGTTAADAAAVAKYFHSFGFATTTSGDHRFVWVRGTMAQAAAASHSTYERVQIVEHSGPTGATTTVKFAPFVRLAHAASFPTAIGDLIRATTLSPGPKVPSLITTLPNPLNGFGPADFAGIYNINPAYAAGLNGAGTTIASPECGLANQASLNYFETNFGLPHNHIQFVSVDGTPPTADQIGLEPLLDAERVIGTAPAATVKMYFIDGFTCDIGTFADIYTKIASDNDVTAVTISYGLSEATWGAIGAGSDRDAWQAGIEAIADDGIPMFASSGDSGAFSDFFLDAIDATYPASDPNVVACGGTTTYESAIGTRLFEDVWSGGGGGVSGIFQIPSWQVGVPGLASSLFRNLPDVSFDSDPNTGVDVLAYAPTIGIPQEQIEVGGTSASAPSWAGIYALIAQNRAMAGHARLHNVPSVLYGLRTTPGIFAQITVGDNGYYPAGKGYNNATGLGVPNVWNLIQALK